MEIEISGSLPVRCECGHEHAISVARLEDAFHCPACNVQDRLTDEQVEEVKDQMRRDAIEFGAGKVREAIDQGLSRATRARKTLTNRKEERQSAMEGKGGEER